jgi:hypothetical protein
MPPSNKKAFYKPHQLLQSFLVKIQAQSKHKIYFKGDSTRALKTRRFERVLYNLHSSVPNTRYTSAQNTALEMLAVRFFYKWRLNSAF